MERSFSDSGEGPADRLGGWQNLYADVAAAKLDDLNAKAEADEELLPQPMTIEQFNGRNSDEHTPKKHFSYQSFWFRMTVFAQVKEKPYDAGR